MVSAYEWASAAVTWFSDASSNTANNAGNFQIGIINTILSVSLINEIKIQIVFGIFLVLSALFVVFFCIRREINEGKKKEAREEKDRKQKKKEKELEKEKIKREKEKETKRIEKDLEEERKQKEFEEKELLKKKREKEIEEKKREKEQEEKKKEMEKKIKFIRDHQAKCPSCSKLGKLSNISYSMGRNIKRGFPLIYINFLYQNIYVFLEQKNMNF